MVHSLLSISRLLFAHIYIYTKPFHQHMYHNYICITPTHDKAFKFRRALGFRRVGTVENADPWAFELISGWPRSTYIVRPVDGEGLGDVLVILPSESQLIACSSR